jgi:3-oxoacyl-[acyl-carrier-protein] synthase II
MSVPDGAPVGERMPRVVVTGLGVLTALGDSPEALHAALCEGRGGLQPVDWAENGAMPPRLAGRVDFDPKTYLGDGNLRPLDRTGRLAVAASGLALEAAGWTAEMRRETEVGLVLGTMFGSVHTISGFDRRAMEAGPNYAKPMEFANSVINAAAGQTAIWHDLWGINATISGGTASGAQAIAYAADLIRTGRAAALLAGGVEELCFESVHGFDRAGLLYDPAAGDGAPAAPYDARRSGFALAEGAAFLMLEEAGAAAARGADVLAEIRGQGDAFDGSRGRDEDSRAAALARSVAAALERAGTEPAELVCASLAGNGSPAGDRCEARGLALALGETTADLPAVAIKSMLGESLGASGALQAVVAIQSLLSGVLPGTAGLERPEDGLPLARIGPAGATIGRGCGLVTGPGLEGSSCSLVIEVV